MWIFYHCGRRNTWKTILVEQVSSNLSNARFSGEHSGPKSLRTKRACMISWIVWRESFLIYWLEHSEGVFLSPSEKVSATGSVFGEFWVQTFDKSLLNLIYGIPKFLGALHGGKELDTVRNSFLVNESAPLLPFDCKLGRWARWLGRWGRLRVPALLIAPSRDLVHIFTRLPFLYFYLNVLCVELAQLFQVRSQSQQDHLVNVITTIFQRYVLPKALTRTFRRPCNFEVGSYSLQHLLQLAFLHLFAEEPIVV